MAGTVEFDIEVRPGKRLDQANLGREPSPHGVVLHLGGILTSFGARNDVERMVEADGRLTARMAMQPGSRTVLALLASANEALILPALEAIHARIDRSDQAWREWSDNLTCDGTYAEAVRRSALSLKLLLFTPTGATAAAATTSLPEWMGGGRTYDYRFACVRDVAYTIKAFLRVGAVEEAKAAFSWLTATIRRHGDLLETAALFVECGHVLDLVTRRLLAELTDRCADLWRSRDSGIWELEAVEHYTMSKLGCWTALDRAVTLAGAGQIDARHVDRWRRERDRIRDWVDAHCWSEAKQSTPCTLGRSGWTRPCCWLPASGSSAVTGWRLPARQFGGSYAAGRWCIGIRAWRPRRAPSWPARSGWLRRSPCSANGMLRCGRWTRCSRPRAVTWDCCTSRWTRPMAPCWATCRRP